MGLDVLAEFCREKGMTLTLEQLSAFEQYREGLYRLNEVMNLTRVPVEDCELRHFVDSLLVASFIPVGASVLDIGTGPGLPAWPLACARPDLRVTAMDSSGKMLRGLGLVPLPNLVVRQHRAEEPDKREGFDFATGRAVAPLEQQMEISAAWVRVGGLFVPFRTVSEREAIEASDFGVFGMQLEEIEEGPLPGTDIVRLFPVYRKTKKTPKQYPRTWGQIRTKPVSGPLT